MTLLEAPEIVLMRETAERAMDSTAVVETQTSASDGVGGESETWTVVDTFPCRLAPFLRGKEEVEGERLTGDTEVIFTFPAETPITHSSRIVFEGKTYNVVDVKARSIEITRRVTAVVIE